jgi:multicomponent Na+:H+ antiporter subunit D
LVSPLFLLIPIFLPIAGGALLLARRAPSDRFRNIYTECVALLTSAAVWIAIWLCSREPMTLYSFASGFTISLFVDGPAILFAGMVSVMWPVILLYAFSYMADETRKDSFFAFYIMTYGITLGLAFSADILTLYVFFEMLTLVTIPLVTHGEDHESMRAGRVYATYLIGGASLGFFAVIMVTLFSADGMFLPGGCLLDGADRSLMLLVYLFGFFGFGTKAAIFPFYAWLPGASVAPTPVTALLHAVAVVNSGVFAVMRLTYYCFGAAYLDGTWVQHVCVITAAVSTVFSAAMALKERHFKRRLAYSTASNLSYMLLGLMMLSYDGLVAGMTHMLFHGIIKMSLFMCAGAFMKQTGRAYIYELNGVGRRMPVTFVLYTVGALSISGVPPFEGFISKWLLLVSAAGEGTAYGVIAAFALIIAAFFCTIYTLSVSIRAFFPPKQRDLYADDTTVREADWLMLGPILFFSVFNPLFGIWSGPILTFIRTIFQGVA